MIVKPKKRESREEGKDKGQMTVQEAFYQEEIEEF